LREEKAIRSSQSGANLKLSARAIVRRCWTQACIET